MTTPKVYDSICKVMAAIGHTGIAKGRKNQMQGYNFRGIDDVYNELNSLLSANNLIMTPRILTREVAERMSSKGGALFYVTVEAEFDFISAEDGSKHTVRTFGEAMDSADKATNKAMSAAYKYAAMMVFCIPTEGDNDADAVTHDVAPGTPNTVTGPAIVKTTSSAALKRADVWPQLEAELAECQTVSDVTKLALGWSIIADRDKWPAAWKASAREAMEKRRDEVAIAPDDDVFPGDLPNGIRNNPLRAG